MRHMDFFSQKVAKSWPWQNTELYRETHSLCLMEKLMLILFKKSLSNDLVDHTVLDGFISLSLNLAY